MKWWFDFIIGSLGYAHLKLQQELRDANIAVEKAKRDNFKKNKNFSLVKREMEERRRARAKVRFWNRISSLVFIYILGLNN